MMLILALLMVLFANHMDERLAEGKTVIHCRNGGTDRSMAKREEKESLLVNTSKKPNNEDTLIEPPP